LSEAGGFACVLHRISTITTAKYDLCRADR
jgi:hypothetical protein